MANVYVFAISDTKQTVTSRGFDSPIRAIETGDLFAYTCDAKFDKIRPRRKHLKVHHTAVSELMDGGDTLPMSFGMIADSDKDVRKFVLEHQDGLKQQIQHVRGNVEIAVRLKFGSEDVYAYLVENDSYLKSLRDQVFAGDNPRQDERVELGRQFSATLSRHRDAHAALVEEELLKACVAIRKNDPAGDEEILNFACLVPKDLTKQFDEQLAGIADQLPDAFQFRVSQGLAPYSFVDVRP